MKSTFDVEWLGGRPHGQVHVSHGKVLKMRITKGKGKVNGHAFAVSSNGSCRLQITVTTVPPAIGPNSPVVSVSTNEKPFSFFVRDLKPGEPLLVSACGAVVLPAGESRSYVEVEQTFRDGGRLTGLQQIGVEPEESYEAASSHTRAMHVPIWLGLSRNMRLFEFDLMYQQRPSCYIQPRFHGSDIVLPQLGNAPAKYTFEIGRGQGCTEDVSRRLDEGILPILRGTIIDGDVAYNCTAFATLEKRKLTDKNLKGTHFLLADSFGLGSMQTDRQQALCASLLPREMNGGEETVCWFHMEALNHGSVPRYAWFRGPVPASAHASDWSFDTDTGMGIYGDGTVFSICKVNGQIMPQLEMAILLAPGESCRFEFCLPHRPVSGKHAALLTKQRSLDRLAECRAFWHVKLEKGAKLRLPERRLDEMVQAGLLHLELVTYGLEPDHPVAPVVGLYCPIGSESSPIIQFLDSMGRHSLARRALQYFLEKQHEDGFMQNYGGYMLETGAVLWSIGEHYRYTRDNAWICDIKPQLMKACHCLSAWSKRNQRPELRGRGYGMLDGKVADPEDPYHIFMLNGYAYLGMARVAEMLEETDMVESKRIRREAERLKQYIRKALFDGLAASPVAPLGDGSWTPAAPPWAEAKGPLSLFVEAKNCYSHCTFFCRDSLLGPLYLVLQEVLDPHEPATDMMIDYCVELFTVRNVAFSQPYYSPHVRVHALRGEIKPFLKAFYNGFSGLADRETYTFWEHYCHVSPHKTHEEGWFLMQTRWMLYMESGDTLHLLPLIPRDWLAHGKKIELKNIATYFGPVSLEVVSKVNQGVIEATILCDSDRQPKNITLRLPHPAGQRAKRVTVGVYDPGGELLRFTDVKDNVTTRLVF